MADEAKMEKLGLGGAFVLIDAGWEKVRDIAFSSGKILAGVVIHVAGPRTAEGFPAEFKDGFMQEWRRDGRRLILLWADTSHIWHWSIDDSGPMPLDSQKFFAVVDPQH